MLTGPDGFTADLAKRRADLGSRSRSVQLARPAQR